MRVNTLPLTGNFLSAQLQSIAGEGQVAKYWNKKQIFPQHPVVLSQYFNSSFAQHFLFKFLKLTINIISINVD